MRANEVRYPVVRAELRVDFSMRVQVRVQDTIQLRTWLRSLGPDAVVESPEQLRVELRREWADLLSLYGDTH